MPHQIRVIERKADGSEEGRGLCEFVSIPGPGDQIFVTRSTSIDRMRVVAVKHYPLELSNEVQTWFAREPKVDLLAELIESR